MGSGDIHPRLTAGRRGFLLGAGAVGLAAVAGCLGRGRTDTSYTAADSTDAESMNFVRTADENTNARIRLTMDGAYALTEDDRIFPLWMDLEDTGDSQVFVATLRDGLEWGGDYGQMTAEDWVYMIQEVHQGADNWALSTSYGDWSDVTVERTSRLEFQIELAEPNPDWPMEPVLRGAFCLPKGLLEEYVDERDGEGLDQDGEVQELAYTGNLGPYTLDRWERGAEFVAVRNDDYYVRELDEDEFPTFVDDERIGAWRGSPHFEEFTWRAVEEESTRLTALERGEVTETDVPVSRVGKFEDDPDVDVVEVPYPYLSILAYNQRMNGWDELRTPGVRRALSTAVDKTEIAENVLRGSAEIAHTFQPSWSDWYDASQVTEFGEDDSYDPDAARDLLEDELSTGYGYDDGTLLGPDGEQVTLTLVYARGSEPVSTSAQFVGEELERIGIGIEYVDVEFSRLIQQYVQNEWQGEADDRPWSAGSDNDGPRDNSRSERDWDLMYGIRYNTFPRTPAAIDTFWTERASANYFGYVPEADLEGRFDAIRSTTDAAKREALLAETFGILSEEQPVNFVVMSDEIVGYRSAVDGPEAVFGQAWDRHTWTFDGP